MKQCLAVDTLQYLYPNYRRYVFVPRAAFLCPLYDKDNHFELAANLLKSKIDLGITEDLYFIFSNREQQDKFSNLINQRIGNTAYRGG